MSADINSRIRDALQYIPTGPHEERFRMACMIKSELGDNGRDLWDFWRDGRGDDEATSVWRSVSETGALKIGTLFHDAKINGWCDDSNYQPPSPQWLAERKRLNDESDAKEKAETDRMRAVAAKNTAALWKAGTDPADNPYLKRKDVLPTPTLKQIDAAVATAILGYPPKSKGQTLLTGMLLIAPIRQGDTFSTVELIDEAGHKAALMGRGTKTGGYWASEPLPKGNGAGLTLMIGEGVATGLTAKKAKGHPVVAAFSAGNLPAVAKQMRETYPAAVLILLSDLVKATGEPDLHAVAAARAVNGLLAIPVFGPDRAEGDTDFNDQARLFGIEAVRAAIGVAKPVSDADYQAETAEPLDGSAWPEPRPIPCSLLPVEPFDYELLPESLRNWVADIAERMQCPPDFVAVGAMVALSSVIGRKACIQPKRFDDWQVIPNLWGAIVGRPGVMKSPALSEIMKPLDRLQIVASDLHTEAMRDHGIKEKMEGMSGKAAEAKAQKLISKGDINGAEQVLIDAADAEGIASPALRRYKITDATVESLGEILIGNPWGTLAYRDELNGLLRSLDKPGQEGARAFYLQGYDGNQGYTFDRIGRGQNLHIPAVCFSMLGGIQPGKIQAYIRDAMSGGAGDDGLLQRFGMLVWPDADREWRNVDRFPDAAAKNAAYAVFQRLDALQPGIDAEGQAAPAIYRFSEEAQGIFEAWRQDYETDIRSGDHHPAMESHLAKYRKLVPAVALVCALADKETEVSANSVLRAIGWSEYLKTHANRAYASGARPATEGAKALLAKIVEGKVVDGFTTRDVHIKGWAHLSETDEAHAAISLLCDLYQIFRVDKAPSEKGGRPSAFYQINPKVAVDN